MRQRLPPDVVRPGLGDLDRRTRQRLRLRELAALGKQERLAGDVHRIAGGQPPLRPGHHLARVHADPTANTELGQRAAHLHRRPAGAQCVVLMRGRDAEDGHDGVADELLHRAAVRLNDRLHALEVAREQRPEDLRIRGLPELRRSRDVAEHHGHGLAGEHGSG
ncbi:MAG TPA: hypothetical protein VFU10_02690 [Gaiellaceae bacterium]|nr:hypothetical protein [Gaiellaceae bacterium]